MFFALVGKNEASTGKGFDLVEIHCQLAEDGKGGLEHGDTHSTMNLTFCGGNHGSSFGILL